MPAILSIPTTPTMTTPKLYTASVLASGKPVPTAKPAATEPKKRVYKKKTANVAEPIPAVPPPIPHPEPSKKEIAAAKRKAAADAKKQLKRDIEAGVSFVVGATPAEHDPTPASTDGPQVPLPAKKRSHKKTLSVASVPEQQQQQQQQQPVDETVKVEEQPVTEPEIDDEIEQPKRKKPTPAPRSEDEPPKWLQDLLGQFIKDKAERDNEKLSKKKIKETAEKEASEKWSNPDVRVKSEGYMDSHMKRMHKMIFS